MRIEDIYKAQPFKIRNAEELELKEILTRFVNPNDKMSEHFDFENKIIRGRKGSGKTMYLKANYAHNFFEIIPNLSENIPFILPILIQLNDFATIKDKDQLYKLIIGKIISKIIEECKNIYDLKKLNPIHTSLKMAPILDKKYEESISNASFELLQLNSDSYAKKIGKITKAKGTFGYNVNHITVEVEKDYEMVLTGKREPQISDIDDIHKILLKEYNGNILILIDEVSSLNRNFFNNKDGESYFEILMNQFRTRDYIRTKVAVYSDHYSDILQGIRYGDVLRLEENVTENKGYKKFRELTKNLIRNYLTTAVHNCLVEQDIIEPELIFQFNADGDDCIEQLIYASGGNMRRLVSLLNLTMTNTYSKYPEGIIIQKKHAINALIQQSEEMEKVIKTYQDKEFLDKITRFCKMKKTYRFHFINKSAKLRKFYANSREFNLINIVSNSGYCNTYYFDYSYCIAHNLPTHINNRGVIDENRSLSTTIMMKIQSAKQIHVETKWILTPAIISDDQDLTTDYIIRSFGTVLLRDDENSIIKGDDGCEYKFSKNDILTKSQPIIQNDRVRFIPGTLREPMRALLLELVEK